MTSAILLINLGTPTEPTPAAVRKYLKEFLSDPYVVEIPRLPWWIILNCFILPRRGKESAARYASVWTKEGSPLRFHTEKQMKFVRGYIGERKRADVMVDYAMRYGEPSIKSQLSVFKEKNIERVVLLPLYPQYARSSTATAIDAAKAAFKFENPKLHNPGTVDCVSCHVAQPARSFTMLQFPSLQLDQLSREFVYTSSRNLLNQSPRQSQTNIVRAFGYFENSPFVAQRTINESAEVLNYFYQNYK